MTAELVFEGQHVVTREDETVLDALLRTGVDVAFSCKGGSCLTCILQCESGDLPVAAQKNLPSCLQRLRYFLPCSCVPTGVMKVRRPQPDDLLTSCYVCEATVQDDGSVQMLFEATRTLRYRKGQTLKIVTGTDPEPVLELTSDPDKDYVLIGTLSASEAAKVPAAIRDNPEFGVEFEVRGPFDDRIAQELPYPEPDPGLWAMMDDGLVARKVLEAFYLKVYADALLSPFFDGVSMARAIDKQYSFMKQCITGEKIYMGDRPRNAHHWMIITHELFDHRQSLMLQTMTEQGVSTDVIARWTHIEEYFRPDIVKSHTWPKQMGDELVYTEGFSQEILGEATLCDHCQQEVQAGEQVLMHRRLGTISCSRCMGAEK